MQHTFARFGAFCAASSLVLLAACSGGGSLPQSNSLSPSVPQSAASRTAVSAATKAHLVVTGVHNIAPISVPIKPPGPLTATAGTGVWTNGIIIGSDFYDGVVNFYQANNHAQIFSLSGFNLPNGMDIASAPGDLYVANEGSSPQIIYDIPIPWNGNYSMLTDPGTNPVGVMVHNSHVYVSNLGCPVSECGTGTPGGVVMFGPHTSNGVMFSGGPYNVWSTAIDPYTGNLWAIGEDGSGNNIIGYWPAGMRTGFVADPNISFNFPGDIGFTGADQLLVGDQLSAQGGGNLEVYLDDVYEGYFRLQNGYDDIFHWDITGNRVFAADVSAQTIRWYSYYDSLYGILGNPNSFGVTERLVDVSNTSAKVQPSK